MSRCNLRFEGKTILVTGGAGAGLGSLLSREFAVEGASVIIADVLGSSVMELSSQLRGQGGQVLGIEVDISDSESVQAMYRSTVDACGPVDVLINNATFAGSDAALVDLTDQDWDRPVGVVLKGCFLCCRAVLPGMISKGHGVIVNIGSVNSEAFFGNEAYSSAKAGVVSLTRSIAARYGPVGIRANVVLPGTLRTQSPSWRTRQEKDPNVFEHLAKWYPLGRVGTPSDVAPAVLFLASDDASWISGAALPIDGGLLAGNLAMTSDLLGGALISVEHADKPGENQGSIAPRKPHGGSDVGGPDDA